MACASATSNWCTFPGELTVEIGLNMKRASATPHAFVAGYTNGYIYYTPTVEQRSKTGRRAGGLRLHGRPRVAENL